ncbi:MAG TPA: hypothetical protein VFI63_00930, partial [Solirubrobacterales bacterium]|nr:hypothetical protein [Solirubrobacterales bacterium]
MRDPFLNEALKRLAAEAATRFSSLVASGERIPFDVAEQAGPEALFHSYLPLTAQFVHERAAELRSLPSFEPAREAVEEAGIAASYLEGRGEPVPTDAGERAARMLTVFVAALWDGCAEFSLDRERLDGALAVLDAEVSGVDEAEVLIVPLAGLRMPLRRLRLPSGVQVLRADAFDAPLEAMRSEGMGRAAWEPQFLALAEQGEGPESAAEALRQLRELISVMRLFKAGGVGLGPFAFAPTGEGRRRRVATGAPATRPGGYELSEEEAAELAELASALEARPDPSGALAWAVRRFELGLERGSALEGLSDHLLALRALLGGEGPIGASLPKRAAALIASEAGGRTAAAERIERALELERELMSGTAASGAATPGEDMRQSPAELASWVEESVRGMLRAAALGELGTDLGTAADETLIATGLAEGDAEITVSAGDPPAPAIDGEIWDETRADRLEPRLEEEDDMEDTRILEPIPAEGEIRITATHWLDEVESGEGAGTIEWPAGRSDAAHRERIDTPRVRHLFPVPEDADWEVRELDYDHYRRRA